MASQSAAVQTGNNINGLKDLGKNTHDSQDFRAENGSSQGQDLILTVLSKMSSLDSGLHGRFVHAIYGCDT